MAVKKTSASNSSKQPATKSDINALRVEFKTDIKALQTEFKADLETNVKELAQIMTEGIAYLSNGQEDVKTELKADINEVKLRVDKIETQVSDTNRRLRDVEFDTPTRMDFQKLKQRVDLSAVNPSFEP